MSICYVEIVVAFIFWIQHKTADSAPFVKNFKGGLKAARETVAALESIPQGLKITSTKPDLNATYPLLRVFASWPGEANVERLLNERPTKEVEANSVQTPEDTSSAQTPEDTEQLPYDPDPHPLAYLDLTTFGKVGEELNKKHFRGNFAQEQMVF